MTSCEEGMTMTFSACLGLIEGYQIDHDFF